MLFKQTAVAGGVAVFVFLFVILRKRREAWRFALAWAGIVGALTLALVSGFGFAYVEQAIVFHLAKGHLLSAGERLAAIARLSLDPVSVVALAGGILFLRRLRPRGLWLPLLMLAAHVALYWLCSSTYWPHSPITAAGYLSFFAGYFAWTVSASVAAPHKREGKPSPSLVAVCVCLAIALAASLGWGEGVFLTEPLSYLPNARRGAVRSEIRSLSRRVKEWSAPGEQVFVPGIIALEAGREAMVPDLEFTGVMRWLHEQIGNVGLLETIRLGRSKPFWDLVRESCPYWAEDVQRGFRSGRIKLAVLPRVMSDKYPRTLGSPLYRVVEKTQNYLVVRPAPASRPQSRDGWRKGR